LNGFNFALLDVTLIKVPATKIW